MLLNFDCNYFIARTNLASVLSLQKQFEKARAVLWHAVKLNPERTLKKLETDADYRLLKQYENFYSGSSQIGMLYRHYCYMPANPAEIDTKLPALIASSSLKNHAKSYSVATRYAFKSDFNKNGVADRVYPLIIRHLHSVLVVFDGDKLESKGCTSTPLIRHDLSGISRDDPCKIKLFAGAQEGKLGIRLETDHIGISRLVCR